MTRGRQHPGRDDTKAYLDGGGIASLASAAFVNKKLVRVADIHSPA
ncbi:MAG: hypothetical protein Q8K82_17845 [Gemmatimonadaceae bacterium]|nr:hypothetical protein [Gemmatimonadaceae bacterium]